MNMRSRTMTNREWIEIISKEFNVSHTVAKGMLSAMYTARKILSVNRAERKKKEEMLAQQEAELAYYESLDYDDWLFASKKGTE